MVSTDCTKLFFSSFYLLIYLFALFSASIYFYDLTLDQIYFKQPLLLGKVRLIFLFLSFFSEKI